jgi:S1-C subfamily serine protease
MLKKVCALALLVFFAQSAVAKELPDFTALVEKQGASVVNISTTQTVQAQQMIPSIPGLPEGDPLAELFRLDVLIGYGAGKRSFFVAKQQALNEVFRNSGAIDRNKGLAWSFA